MDVGVNESIIAVAPPLAVIVSPAMNESAVDSIFKIYLSVSTDFKTPVAPDVPPTIVSSILNCPVIFLIR